jgi:hypothetical protein
MASIQLSIPSFHPPETQSLAQARQKVVDSLNAAVRAMNLSLFSLAATGELSNAEIEKSYERIGFAVDAFREEQALAVVFQMENNPEQPSEIVMPHVAAAVLAGRVQ